MKKLSFLLCISSLLCFSINSSSKQSINRKDELILERATLAEEISNLAKKDPESLLDVIAGSPFEATCTASGRYKSTSDFHIAILRGDLFAISAVLAHEDMKLQAKLRGKYFNPRAAVKEAAKLSVFLIKKEQAYQEEQAAKQAKKKPK